jgi:hypothetical protein
VIAGPLRAALLALVVCGCAGSVDRPAAPLGDARLETARRAAGLAFARGHYDQAVRLYAQALAIAQERDDGAALGDIGFDLAVAQLRRGDPAASLAASAVARAELRRHGLAAFPELALVEAAALRRRGDGAAAERVATGLVDEGGDTARRARFLLGMIAADRGDAAGLSAHLTALAETTDPEWAADRAELAARLASLRGDHAVAGAGFAAAADLRRAALDYPGMARALAAGADSAVLRGDPAAAAALYLRAGRSQLLAGGGPESAEAWLGAAERIARETGDRGVLDALAALRSRRD